jgi:hypothetical protein
MLAIDYVKFKPETHHAKWGLTSKNLQDKLHACYNSLWGTMLHHGDKTSNYDHPGIAYDPLTYLPRPEMCKSAGHWYPAKAVPADTCVDCGHVQTEAEVAEAKAAARRSTMAAKIRNVYTRPWKHYSSGLSKWPSDLELGYLDAADGPKKIGYPWDTQSLDDKPLPGDFDYVSDGNDYSEADAELDHAYFTAMARDGAFSTKSEVKPLLPVGPSQLHLDSLARGGAHYNGCGCFTSATVPQRETKRERRQRRAAERAASAERERNARHRPPASKTPASK